MLNTDVLGHIFNVQSYCIHDGPGIRTTVFLKGCPLSCRWCQNPESQQVSPQLMFYSDRCGSCGSCAAACPKKAISRPPGGKPRTDRHRCEACGICVPICQAGAREITGKTVSVAETLDAALADRLFFEGSGGGITLSGGEPLFQPAFSAALLAAVQAQGVHTAIESCNFAAREVIDRVYAHVDLALCDIKHMHAETHRRLTGVSNVQILNNIRYIRHVLKKPMWIRVPVVPGYNGDVESICAIARFVAEELGDEVPMQLLPYHRLGESKGRSLEMPDHKLSVEPPAEGFLAECRAAAERFGLAVKIGG